MEGAQDEVQLLPALGEDGPGGGGVGGGGAQLDAEAEGELVPKGGSDGVELGPGGGPVEGGAGVPVQIQQVAVVGDAELAEAGGKGGLGGVKEFGFTVGRNFGVAVQIAEIHRNHLKKCSQSRITVRQGGGPAPTGASWGTSGGNR